MGDPSSELQNSTAQDLGGTRVGWAALQVSFGTGLLCYLLSSSLELLQVKHLHPNLLAFVLQTTDDCGSGTLLALLPSHVR